MSVRTAFLGALAAAVLALSAPAAMAEVIEVKMLNKGADGERMVFEPAFVKANVGDVVRFVPTDKSHNVQSIKGMIPEGAEAWKGGLNKVIEVELTQEGVYGYKCLPHYALGMVGLIVVGDASVNLDAAQAVRQRGKKVKKRFAALFDQVGQ